MAVEKFVLTFSQPSPHDLTIGAYRFDCRHKGLAKAGPLKPYC